MTSTTPCSGGTGSRQSARWRSSSKRHCNRYSLASFISSGLRPNWHSDCWFEERRERQEGEVMPEKQTIEHAKRDKRQGKSPSTQAGEFVREEIHHIREGKHGARSTEQAIAIGLSKARRAGVKLPVPAKGKA